MGLLPALPTRSHQDATLNFERLQKELSEGWCGEWKELTLGAKIKAVGAFQAQGVRQEQHKASVRLRGAVAPKAAEPLKAGETLATLPVGFRPSTNVLLSLVTNKEANAMTVAASGVMTLNLEVGAEVNIPLDGLGWNLT